MTWLTPMYAAVAAGIAIPTLLLLYFLKLRRRDVEVSSTLLWKKAIQDVYANAPFQRLRRNLLLFLQLLALVGLILALGQVQFRGRAVAGGRHIILIDRSGSMAAVDELDPRGDAVSRLNEAKRQAISLVDAMSEGSVFARASGGDEAMVIAFAGGAEVRQAFTSDKGLLKSAIESITPTDGPTSIEEAVRLAAAHKPRRSGAETDPAGEQPLPVTIHVYSDGRLPDAEKARPDPADTVLYHRTGKAAALNFAIVGLRAERSYDNPNKLSIFVAVQSNDPQARTVDVEMSIDGSIAAIRPLSLPGTGAVEPPPGAPAKEGAAPIAAPPAAEPVSSGVVFQLDRGQGALVQVRVRSGGAPVVGDVLDADDRAWLVVPPAKKMSVAVVGRDDLFLTSALSGLPLSRLDVLTTSQFEQRARDGGLGQYDVVVLNGWSPGADATGSGTPASSLPAGRYLVLGAVPGGMGITDKGRADAADVVDWRRDHPALRFANLASIQIAVSNPVELVRDSGAIALATADNGPIIIEAGAGDARAIVVPFNPGDSDWPFKPSFVLFLASTINYLGEDSFSTGGHMLTLGGALSDRIPAGATNVQLLLPGGERQALTSGLDGRVDYGPINTVGVYELSWVGTPGPTDFTNAAGRVVRTFVADMLSPVESDIAAAERIALATTLVQAQTQRESESQRDLWPWLILAALGIAMFEWFIYNRKVYL